MKGKAKEKNPEHEGHWTSGRLCSGARARCAPSKGKPHLHVRCECGARWIWRETRRTQLTYFTTPGTQYQRHTGRQRKAMATGQTFGSSVQVTKLTPEEIAERYESKPRAAVPPAAAQDRTPRDPCRQGSFAFLAGVHQAWAG